MIRTRFAPSPTGYLHVGGLRTALYSYLIAKKNSGQFLLRIEDTDQSRFVPDSVMNLVKSLYWGQVIPDEGVKLSGNEIAQEGEKGPYVQSERIALYRERAEQLIAKGVAYRCFCSEERLNTLRETQQKNKIPTGYDGFCMKLSSEEVEAKLAEKASFTIRLKMPKTGTTTVNDLIRGEVSFKNELQEDFIMIKSDGFPTYHLASVVDDHFMEISHVIRGEEWLSSVPKHLQLYTAFGWQPPQFAHIPLLLNADKSKLSKRQGDVAVEDYKKKGYLPEALLNFVAFLGWNPGDEREMFTLEELAREFSLEKVSKAGAVFNLEKLNWYNKEYIKRLSNEAFLERSIPWLVEGGLVSETQLNDSVYRTWLARAVALEKERVTTLAELPEAIKFLFALPDFAKEMLVWRKGTIEEVQKILPELVQLLNGVADEVWNKAQLEQVVGEWMKEKGYATGSVLWPLRVSLSGQQFSPGPYEIAEVLGKTESLRRLQEALKKIA